MKIIDTHAHVTCDDLFNHIDDITTRAKEAGLVKILIVCTSFEEAKRALELAEKDNLYDCAFGFHPENADEVSDEDLDQLKQILMHPKMVALGEIGLDYHWRQDNKNVQKALFIKQINLANELDLPILVHMRDATADTLEIFKQHPVKGVMHCYSGSLETTKLLLKLGFYISFAGPLTFKNAHEALNVCEYVPIDRIFVETDCPYMTPHPHRGKQNEPYYVQFTFMKACEIKGLNPEDLSNAMLNNYRCLFTKSNA